MQVIHSFVGTIITKINWALEQLQKQEGGMALFLQEMDFSDPEAMAKFLEAGQREEGVVVLVGRRFLSSVVRVLSLEHSRVKNRFLEMQQGRQGEWVGQVGGARGRGMI